MVSLGGGQSKSLRLKILLMLLVETHTAHLTLFLPACGITVYGLIQPMAGRNRVKPALPANLAQSFFQNRPAFTSKQQSFNSLVLEKQAYVSW